MKKKLFEKNENKKTRRWNQRWRPGSHYGPVMSGRFEKDDVKPVFKMVNEFRSIQSVTVERERRDPRRIQRENKINAM